MRLRLRDLIDNILALLIIFETIAIGQLALDPFSLYSVGSFAWYQAQVLRGLSTFSPLLIVILLYAWLARAALKIARKRSIRVAKFTQSLSAFVKGDASTTSPEKFIILRYPAILLIIAMTVAGLLACFPYLPSLNPNANAVGTDTSTYIEWTRQMLARPFPQAISYAFGGADQGFRPLPLLLFYSVGSLGVRPEQAVEFSPVIFGPLLALSTFIFVRTGSKNSGMAAVSALVTPFSFEVTVGIWAGYLANWLAMIVTFFFLTCFIIFARSSRKALIIPALLLSLAILLSHPWTWALILVTTLIFALTRTGSERRLLTGLSVLLIVVGTIIDIAKNQVAGATSLAADLGTKAPVFGISQFIMFWPNVSASLNVFYDGLLGNVLLLGLGALSFIAIRAYDRMEGILGCWVASASIPFVLLNSFHQTRLIYDLPISPLLAIALILLMSKAGGGNLRASLLLLVVLLFSANSALGSVIQA